MNVQEKYYTGKKRCPEHCESRTLTIVMRTYRPGDEEGMTACIREEYGDTYYKRDFYKPEYLAKAAGGEKHTFLVAQTRAGEIAGMLVLEAVGGETVLCSIESLFIRKKYRGYGLAAPFLQYGTEIAISQKYAAACCCPVLFHDITQRLLYRMRFRATGFLLNVFDGTEMAHSFRKERVKRKTFLSVKCKGLQKRAKECKTIKHSLGLQLLPIGKRNAGKLYVPSEHRKFIAGVYQNLSMEFQVVQGGRSRTKDMPPVSELSCHAEPRRKSLEIRILHSGMDLFERMAEIHDRYPPKGMWTVNVFLNLGERWAGWAYGKLRKLHYFFTGLCSLGNAGEYMILHHPGEVECFTEDLAVSPEFAEILKYIRKQYERRNAYEKKKTQHPS